MRWLEAFHVVFVVTWFAGLFYLPRLFVYAAENPAGHTFELLKIMQRRLLYITHIGGALAVGFGLATLIGEPWHLSTGGWMHVKLALVAALIGYHVWCWRLVQVFARGENSHSSKWYRVFNEAPSVLLIAVVVLVIVKPF
ncbi:MULTISPECIES: CopD family protein [unclassified Wenzhouxiangella]|uniref:CopD family protein n=1 Tax=unclassified Wenzhouxiangella TaxID=2613841 RepID=UPI000E325B39|nr:MULTISPECIES: CopD family protein [unclassified Wenzhouxiangella]RFF28564.1 CopD family protein [Wenzhouxiangella sp. 15181]RFP70082.1 CopD family protein [Wenzhouxiangella sp. 15190]